MTLVLLLAVLAALCVYTATVGGLSNVARQRKYKSGTGWCFWRWTDVDSEYILRLHLIKTPWCAVCLHWIRKPDAEVWLHDHPVSFLSIILRGKYAELRQTLDEHTPRYRVHGWFNFIRASDRDRHRIIFCRKNTLTLCFMGPKTREWGFHTPRGWIHWKQYYAKKRAEEEPLDKAGVAFFWKELDAQIDAMVASFNTQYSGKVFIDKNVRLISTVPGDFDDEAKTTPRGENA